MTLRGRFGVSDTASPFGRDNNAEHLTCFGGAGDVNDGDGAGGVAIGCCGSRCTEFEDETRIPIGRLVIDVDNVDDESKRIIIFSQKNG